MTCVVFDLGKVLLDFDYSIAARRIAARSRRSIDVATFFAEHAGLLLRYELGRLTTEEFLAELSGACDFNGAVGEFGEFFADVFAPLPSMLELHASVRQAGYPTYIFSNTNELAVRHIRERFPFFANFDGYILSYEHGAMKPDPRLYEVVERETRSAGAEIVYVDDLAENVAGGLARGWRAIQHVSPDLTRRALERLVG